MPKRPLPAAPRTPIREGAAADLRLQQLGVPNAGTIVAAINDGASGARAATKYHPKSFAGQRMWGDSTAALRVYLEPYDWESLYFHGVDLVLSRRTGIALIVTASDAATGDRRYIPQVRYERKEVIQGLINGHAATLWDAQEPPEWDCWFVLHYLTKTELRGEVSRPAGIGRTGMVTSWSERILLPSTPFGAAPRTTRRTAMAPAAIDVPVQRRAR